MTPSVTSSSPVSGAATPASSSAAASASIASKDQNTFLQLLVAELEHQDPTNPTDGTQFVTQLAEFQQLQTTMNMATDLTGIRSDTDKLAAADATTGAGSNSISTSGQTGAAGATSSSTQS